jgi:acetyl esterase/lipase
LAATNAQSRIPWVGHYFDDMGSLAALSFWGVKHGPEIVTAVRRRRATHIADERRRQRDRTVDATAAAMASVIAEHGLDVTWPAPQRVPPVFHAAKQRRLVYAESVAYGSQPGQLLDVWRRPDRCADPLPVLIFIPGGAWVFGKRLVQGHALMSHLASHGWLCLSVQYRAAPSHKWPRQLHDVKTAIAWARANVDMFGGDRDFVAVAGCSAGGHLASLAALTAGDARYQAHLSDSADTTVDAVASIYGRYDWKDRSPGERARFVDFLERVVVQRRYEYAADVFADASPITHIRAQCPPFLLVHGTDDCIIPVEEARVFAERLGRVSSQPVTYLELPGAEHAFDLTDRVRTGPVNTAIGVFLDAAYRRHHPSRSGAAASH